MDDIRTVSVTAAATSYDLTRLDVVKSELRITARTDDEILGSMIRRASKAIATYCDRVFALETVVETFRLFQAREFLLLSRIPNVVISSITENDAALTSSDYEVDADTGRLLRLCNDTPVYWPAAGFVGGLWFGGLGKVVVTYRGGYELLPGLPTDIEDACIRLIKSMWFARARDPMVRAETIPGVIEQQYWIGGTPGADPGALPPDVVSLLDPYRNLIA